MLEVQYDENDSLLFVNNKDILRRIDITSVRDALNGYQKGKCFYSLQDISIVSGDYNLCHVDHFLPHVNIVTHFRNSANLNGVWNLVLADKDINNSKRARIPDIKFLFRLFKRNEFYIESKHPLAETIINQTGKSKEQRRLFLQNQYNIALENSSQVPWTPDIELEGNF
jgi:CRISPR/Cas system Type II protein with McrA/HNH and RuvC-like nuclease domain